MSGLTPVRPLGLALSGGALKAAAHVGVLQALESMGIRPDCVAGTSAGSLVAALYAHGVRPEGMMDIIRQFPGPFLLDYGFPLLSSLFALWSRRIRRSRALRLPGGLVRGRRLERYIRRLLGRREARMRYYIIATDLFTGQPVTLTNDAAALDLGFDPVDDAAVAIRGSCSLPGVFSPVSCGQRLLTDGGIRDYVPVRVLRQAGCRRIIAVNLHELDVDWNPDTFVHVVARAINILLQETVAADTAGDDVITLTPRLPSMTWWSFHQMTACVRAGRLAVWENRDRILRHVSG
ncbi:patatin-like phospholipase family protein [Alicyclobacillus macrosporangiidus]|uniref:NTE family protein n=1 Tax=Alicyclobacillus macrosporangiidus TaxID=392015 RepID=A0A1I7L7A9_9BACL|nr:patatin-like phospholipase family protein [Alicyclobacillus macrosporangiidus]SFV05627.1 NTE family protein [Alicyclobacillus macrosporangiidus]